MKIFEVIYWGSLTERGNPKSTYDADAEDTIYLVSAPDFKAAIDFIACNSMRCYLNPARAPDYIPDRVVELRTATHSINEITLLRGPYYDSARFYGPAWAPETEPPVKST